MNLFSQKEKKALLYKFDLFEKELINFLGSNNVKYKKIEQQLKKLKDKLEQNAKNPYISEYNHLLPYCNLIQEISSITKNESFKNHYKAKANREIKDAVGFLVTAFLFPFFIPMAVFNLYKLVQDKNIILDEKPFASIENKTEKLREQDKKVAEEIDEKSAKSNSSGTFNETNKKDKKKVTINEDENEVRFIETKKEIKILTLIEAYHQAGVHLEEENFSNLSKNKIAYLSHENCINAVAQKQVTFETVKSMPEKDLLDANERNRYPKAIDNGISQSQSIAKKI